MFLFFNIFEVWVNIVVWELKRLVEGSRMNYILGYINDYDLGILFIIKFFFKFLKVWYLDNCV